MAHQGLTTRREFYHTLALLGTAALSTPLTSQIAEASQAGPSTTAADTLAELIRVRYGKHLSEEELKSARRAIERNLLSVELLKRFPLKNSDEPDFVFSPDLAEES